MYHFNDNMCLPMQNSNPGMSYDEDLKQYANTWFQLNLADASTPFKGSIPILYGGAVPRGGIDLINATKPKYYYNRGLYFDGVETPTELPNLIVKGLNAEGTYVDMELYST